MRPAALAATAGFALLGCLPARVYAPPPHVELAPGAEHSLKVHADGEWQATGITVNRGERYQLTADGRWHIGAICGFTDANGVGVSPFCSSGQIGPELPASSLIGRLGPNGKLFMVGTNLRLNAEQDGDLYLRSNDGAPFYGDNVGSLNVTISRVGTPVAAAPAATAPSAPSVPAAAKPLPVTYKASAVRPDDIAVVIGNSDYAKQGKDIPNVAPAYGDAETAKRYALEALGIREGNLIFLTDATSAQMVRVFGAKDDHRGQLYDWVKPGRSRVFVYYSGHGAPGLQGGSPYLIPADADATRIELNGYPLKTLYDNLGRLPAESVTVVLEACFSGGSQGGAVIANASPVFQRAATPGAPPKVTVISAGAADQIASWEQDKSYGLFTKYFFTGMAGEADKAPHGNGDGHVSLDELDRYLKETLTYYARRYYGRDQAAQIVKGN